MSSEQAPAPLPCRLDGPAGARAPAPRLNAATRRARLVEQAAQAGVDLEWLD